MSRLRLPVRARPKAAAPGIDGWPRAAIEDDGFRVEGRLVGGFELAPLSLELMAETERDAALDGLAAFEDAIARPYMLLSVPADRPPHEHLAILEERLDGRRAASGFSAYAALYRELCAAATRPLRRTFLVLDAASGSELGRVIATVGRVAEERGLVIREVAADEIARLWSDVGRAGTPHRVSVQAAEGDGLLTALALSRRWPAEVAPGWLSGLFAVPGIAAVAMRVRPLPRAEAMGFLTTRLRQVRAAERLAAERGEVADVERERLGATATDARRAVHAGSGRISFVDTVLLLEAPDRSTLAERTEALRLEARSLGVDLETATFRIADAWAAALPGPATRPIAERNLDSGSLAASLLNVASDLYEPAGHLYGRARTTGAPIILDRFSHASHNAIVLGQTGTGKTMFSGAEMHRCFLRGVRVLAVDPLGDYRRLATALGGTYLELGASDGLNPFAFVGATTERSLAAKLAMLDRLLAAMAGGLSRDERPALDRALRAAYTAAGISPDPATHGRHPPTLAEVVERLAEESEGGPLARRLERWATGSLAGLFAASEPLPADRRVLVVGLAAIGDPEVRDVAQLAALSVLWDLVRADLGPKLVVVDEAWKVMRQASGADFIEELARSARHYHAGLQLATQDIVEFLRSPFGEAIVKQCDLRVLLGQTPEGADALVRFFDLTAPERRALIHARPGEGLLFVGRSHTAFEAVVSRREYAMLTSRPADLVAQSQLKYEPPDSS